MLFTSVGGIALQIAASTVCYIGMAVWALGDLIFNGGEGAWNDMNLIGWNPFNNSAENALKANKFSWFSGVPVFMSTKMPTTGLGVVVFMNKKDFLSDAGVKDGGWFLRWIPHEFGHVVQQWLMGPVKWLINIAIPSKWFSSKTENSPYEITADKFSGIMMGRDPSGYSAGDVNKGWSYFWLSCVFVPFWYWL